MMSCEGKEKEFLEVEEGEGHINAIMTEKELVKKYGLSLNALANSYAHNT